MTAPLSHLRRACDGCSRVFTGPFTFVDDDCRRSSTGRRAGHARRGVRSADRWQFYGRVDGEWGLLGAAQDDGTGTYAIEDAQPWSTRGSRSAPSPTRFTFRP
ncbi:MAG: hypothetical protein R3F59_34945 [Myxococcota bacterium]